MLIGDVLLKIAAEENKDIIKCIKYQKEVFEDSIKEFEEKEAVEFYTNGANALSEILEELVQKSKDNNKDIYLNLSSNNFEFFYSAIEIMVDLHLNRKTGELDITRIKTEDGRYISLIKLKKIYETLRQNLMK